MTIASSPFAPRKCARIVAFRSAKVAVLGTRAQEASRAGGWGLA
jgi:hypothetical protein